MPKVSNIQIERDALNTQITALTRSNNILVNQIDRIKAISNVASKSIVIKTSDPDDYYSRLVYGPDMKHLFEMISKIAYEER